jgi:adenosylmethionine-8-amino-7-oxononanoate aminotransferase
MFYRRLTVEYPMVARGEGVYVIDTEGKRYLDASGGAAVSCLGHSDADVIQSIKDQIDRIAYIHSSFFTNSPAEALAEYLVGEAPGDLDWVYFVNGGSEAIEAALKLARQYFIETGEPERNRFIARRQSFHGNTLGALSVGGNAARRAPFAPLLFDAHYVSPCYAYRDQRADETEEAYGERLARELEDAIEELGPETVIGFIAEPVVGSTLGAVPSVAGYFKRVREVCDRHGILLILDEVMCGMGRTGTLFACEQDGVAPDLVTVAKGLGAGYQPIGALLISARIHAALRDGSGIYQHGQTYNAHPTACAAALAVQRKVKELDLLANVRRMGDRLDAALVERFGNHPHVGDIRGRGLFRALELVADRATKEPFDASYKLHARVKQNAMGAGLMCYPMGGVIDGARGDQVLLAPPYIIIDDHIEEMVEKLAIAIEASLGKAAA